MYFVEIDPVAFSILGFGVKWYSLAYIVGILSSLFYCNKFFRENKKLMEDLLFYLPLFIVIGGRIGYVVFYNFGYYAMHPLHIFSLWEGGMSFHGGFLGCVVALKVISKKSDIPFWKLSDLAACCAPIGIFFGRIANFINGELYGNITDVKWGVVFKNLDGFSRHPSQLYEAIGEGLILFLITNYLLFFTGSFKKSARITSIFICGYSIIRIFLETFRTPDLNIGYLLFDMTLGQLLSFPLFLFGFALFIYSLKLHKINEKVHMK